jgi:RNA polymerase sigma factor (sigma-70 family)
MPPKPTPTHASNEFAPDDGELLATIASSSVDAAAQSRAQAEFYERHVRYLYGVLARQKNALLKVAGISPEDLVQDTFHRAFERAHTFDVGDAADPERLRQRTRAWLGRIAQNLVADSFRRVREVSATPYLETLSCEGIDEVPDWARRPDEGQEPSPELDLVYDGLCQLSEVEQDVLRITVLYYRAGGHQRLPNDVSAELAARWSTTNENIRAIRSRALKKLKAYVEKRSGEARQGL